MAYQYVPLGFEMILSEENGVSLLSPGSGGGSWGLWFNVSLNDDPAIWDDEVKRLNQLQVTIPLIGDEQRLVRAQIAEFCRYHPLFPSSVDLSILNVGAEKLLDASNIGCEGRGLLKTLGIQTEKMRIEQGKVLSLNASKALRKAVKGNKPISPQEKKWSLLVRQICLDKKGTMSWLADILARGEPEAKSFRELCSAHGLRECDATPPTERPFNCLHCEEESSPCCFLQQTEATLICISEPDFNEAGKLFRRFYEEYILAYCDALNSWLTDKPPR